MRALAVLVLAAILAAWGGMAAAQQPPPPAPPPPPSTTQAPPAGQPDEAEDDEDDDMAEPQRAMPDRRRERAERGSGAKRQACRQAAQTQGLRGPAMRDHMQVCSLEARLDCLKQAIAQRVTGREERRDFVRQCSR